MSNEKIRGVYMRITSTTPLHMASALELLAVENQTPSQDSNTHQQCDGNSSLHSSNALLDFLEFVQIHSLLAKKFLNYNQ